MLKSRDYRKKLSPESHDLAYTFCCITYSSVSLEACTDLCINTQFLTAVIITPNNTQFLTAVIITPNNTQFLTAVIITPNNTQFLTAVIITSNNTQFLTAVIITPNKQLSIGRFFFECLVQCFLILSSYYTLFFLMSCTINKVPYNQYNILVESFEGSVNQNTKIR